MSSIKSSFFFLLLILSYTSAAGLLRTPVAFLISLLEIIISCNYSAGLLFSNYIFKHSVSSTDDEESLFGGDLSSSLSFCYGYL